MTLFKTRNPLVYETRMSKEEILIILIQSCGGCC